jgi:flagellar hook-length control protein FliK
MGISATSLLPEFAAAATQPGGKAVPANGNGGKDTRDDGFGGLLASFSAPKLEVAKPRNILDPEPNAQDPAAQLQKTLSALAGAKADLKAPGLGLTTAQQQQLLANLRKLSQSSTQDGAQVLASLLAATQLAVVMQPDELASLAQLLGTSAQGSVSPDAVNGNLHLLVQAIQLVADSGGKMTLLQAVQELAPPGDAFAQQLAAAFASTETAPGNGEEPIPIDTGPPKAASPGEAETSATAGSNGRESTVTPNGVTSPADGAAEEGQSKPDVAALAQALEDLLRGQPQAKASSQTAPASEAPAAESQPAAPVDPAVQLAQMAPAAQPKAAVSAVQIDPQNQQAAKAEQSAPTDTKAAVELSAAPLSAAAPAASSNGQERSTGQPADQRPETPLTSVSQSQGLSAASAPTSSFAAALESSSGAASTAPARPALEVAIVDQIVQNATLALRGGAQEFRIQLKPEFLGAMEVRVSVDNGMVAVRMTVESAATRQLIDGSISQLRQAFGTDQVRVEHVPRFTGSDAQWSLGRDGQQSAAGGWQGQSPYGGSNPLPEAIPYNGDDESQATEIAAQQTPVTVQPSTPAASGAIDLKA